MRVSDAVGQALVRAGVDHVFGVVGSGNFHVTNAMVAEGARFVAARHEAGATTMADAYARVSGRVAAVTVHQGCGLTNTMTGLAEAAKSRTPLVVVAAEATEPRSNFYVDQPALARAVGALSVRVDSAEEAVRRAVEAVELAVTTRRTVLLNLPLSVQGEECADTGPGRAGDGTRGLRLRTRRTWSAWPTRCAPRSGRSSSPDAVDAGSAPSCGRSPPAPARCWPSRPSPRTCSGRGSSGRWASRAASPRRRPPS